MRSYYYAGLTPITDRSLEILGGMARLPKLCEVHLDGSPGVTLEGTKVFAKGVHVYHTT